MAYGKLKSEHKVLLRDDERQILRAFGRRPQMCIHELFSLTRVPYPELIKMLDRMVSRGDIVKATPDTALGKHDLQYLRKDEQALSQIQFIDERLSPLIGLTEQGMRGRIIMLNRMKRNLIEDWHPIIDILMGDYERDLKRIEAFRESPDTEPDCQDRDFDDEAMN